MALVDFGWEVLLALNLAFYRTFAVPSIGGLLAATGEMTGRPQKRADDTGLLTYEMIYHGIGHPRGLTAVRRLNQIHRRFDISNDDYRYVLSTLAVVPTRFVDRYGRRRLTATEREATALFYRQVGEHMAIADLPESYVDFAALMDGYEQRHFAPHPAGPALIGATRQLLADRFPGWARRVVLAAGDALLDEPLRRALQVAEPPAAVRMAVHVALRGRAWATRLVPRPLEEVFQPGMPTPTYPDGYAVEELGP